MNPLRKLARYRIALGLVIALAAASANAATITIVNLDGPGEGFNDPTPVAPVGGNPGTTVGAQRLYVFQYAANIWGSLLYSNIETKVDAHFDPLDCDGSSAVLGSAGPNQTWANFPNAPKENTWYHDALANKLANEDLDPTTSEIVANFNSDLGKPECFPLPWYYGVDGNEGPNAVELLPVVLHELGHGLGFSTTSLAGVQQVFPSIYDYYLYDNTQRMHWNEMTDPQRAASSQNCSNLVWDGPSVTGQSAGRLGPKPLLRINGPAAIAGDMNVGLAAFGPLLSEAGVTGDMVYVNDGVPLPNNGCEPIINNVNGKIALIDRGGCPFVIKALNAQNAGAIAMVVADSMPGCPALGMGGADPTITIPSVRITNDDGARIKLQLTLGNTVNATLRVDPALRAGADANHHIQVYTVIPFAPGSSVSHWDTATQPNLLMEPALNPDLSSEVDLTLAQFADIGWFQGLLGVPDAHASVALRSWPNPSAGSTTIGFSLTQPGTARLGIYDLSGRQVRSLIDRNLPEGEHRAMWDGTDDAGDRVGPGVYFYRLDTGAASPVQSRHMIFVR